MRLGGRLSGAIEVLDDIENRRRPVADALKDWGLSRRFAGSGDRAAVGNIVYDALRMKLSHAYVMDTPASAAIAHAVMFRQWGFTPDGLASELEGDRFAPEPLAEQTLQAFASRNIADAEPYIQADLPEWTVPLFEAAFGDDWLREAQALNQRPTLDLRANTLRADRDKVIRSLDQTRAEACAIALNGVRIAAGEGPSRLPNVTSELSFAKGWYEVQDEGSQIVAELVQAAENEQILDYCAGGGGKTLAMAATMNNKGQVHAYDADRRRLSPIIERLRRAGTRNVQTHENEKSLSGLQGRFDRVLVDAPCTGTGTWRRRPDTKWRLTRKNLDERISQQRDALEKAAAYVRPGGLLCYVTCSVLVEENQHQIARFLQRFDDFELVSALDGWRSLFGHQPVMPRTTDGLSITLSPATTGTDGFYFARMRKRP